MAQTGIEGHEPMNLFVQRIFGYRLLLLRHCLEQARRTMELFCLCARCAPGPLLKEHGACAQSNGDLRCRRGCSGFRRRIVLRSALAIGCPGRYPFAKVACPAFETVDPSLDRKAPHSQPVDRERAAPQIVAEFLHCGIAPAAFAAMPIEYACR